MAPKKFSPEFKAEVVRAVIESSRSIAEVAREYGVGPETLRNWVNAYRREHADETPELTENERSELARLRKENRELKAEREFLGNYGRRGRRWSREKGSRVRLAGARVRQGGSGGGCRGGFILRVCVPVDPAELCARFERVGKLGVEGMTRGVLTGAMECRW